MVSEHEKWMREFYQKTGAIQELYHPKPFRGNAVMFLAKDVHWRFSPRTDPRNNWARMIEGSLDIFEVPGNHESVVTEPHIQSLAGRIRDSLAKATQIP